MITEPVQHRAVCPSGHPVGDLRFADSGEQVPPSVVADVAADLAAVGRQGVSQTAAARLEAERCALADLPPLVARGLRQHVACDAYSEDTWRSAQDDAQRLWERS